MWKWGREIVGVIMAGLTSFALALMISWFWRQMKVNRLRHQLLDMIETFESLRRDPSESVRMRLQSLIREPDRLEGIDIEKKRELKSLALQASGLYHFQLEHWDQALDYFNQVLQLSPTAIDALFYKAGCLGYLSRKEQDTDSKNQLLQQAVEASQKVIKLAPRNALNYVALGWMLDEVKRYDEAIQAYDQALAIDPKLSGALYNKACTLAKAGRFDDAMVALQSLTKDPKWLEDAREDDDLTETLGRHDVLGPKFWELASGERERDN